MLPQLLFGSVIWSPHRDGTFSRLEAVPKKLLRYASTKSDFPMNRFDHDFSSISRLCSIYTIKSHHVANDLIFVYSFLTSLCSLPDACELFSTRKIDYFLRNFRPLSEIRCTNDFIFYSPLFRLRRMWNIFIIDFNDINLFDLNKDLIKKHNLKIFDML